MVLPFQDRNGSTTRLVVVFVFPVTDCLLKCLVSVMSLTAPFISGHMPRMKFFTASGWKHPTATAVSNWYHQEQMGLAYLGQCGVLGINFSIPPASSSVGCIISTESISQQCSTLWLVEDYLAHPPK